MRLARYHRVNLIAFTLFLTLLLGVWFVMYRRSKGQLNAQNNVGDQFGQVLDQLVSRPMTPEEMLKQKNDKLDLPYRVCYYNNPNDPTLWYSDNYEVTASSPIVRMTRPIPIDKLEPCTGSTTPLFDLRTDLATVNDGFNMRADDIIKLFLESVYPSIVVVKDTLVKNINYSSVTSTHRLAVACVYRNTQEKYNVLVNQFRIDSTGELSNDPPQTLDKIEGVFTQLNRGGITRTQWSLFAFFSGRSTSTNTVEFFQESGYNVLAGTLQLTNTEDRYIWLDLPILTNYLFLRVTGPGTHQFNRADFYTFLTFDTVKRSDARYVLTATLPPSPPPPPPRPFDELLMNPPTILNRNESISVNRGLISPNRKAALLYQANGDLVLLSDSGQRLWSAGVTSARPSRMLFEQFAIRLFDDGNNKYWDVDTGYFPGDSKLRVTDNGKLEIYYWDRNNVECSWKWAGIVPYVDCEFVPKEKVTWSVP